ncbi:hypothetical protein CCP3SC15_740004 [Gammaproteobacteria bacterium]
MLRSQKFEVILNAVIGLLRGTTIIST